MHNATPIQVSVVTGAMIEAFVTLDVIDEHPDTAGVDTINRAVTAVLTTLWPCTLTQQDIVNKYAEEARRTIMWETNNSGLDLPNTIAAIKLARTLADRDGHRLGLKETKDAIDAIDRRDGHRR